MKTEYDYVWGRTYTTPEPSLIVGAEQSAGPVAEYHFDGNASDSSGNGNNGTINGATFVEGVRGQALSFDGVDDHVEIADSNSLDFGTGDFTIGMWVKPSQLKLDSVLFSKASGRVGEATNGILIEIENDLINFETRNGTTRNGIRTPSGSIADGNWYHVVALRKSGSDGYRKIFLNGVERMNASPLNADVTNTIALKVGYDVSANRLFNGLIDEVRIYNRALSADEIKSYYENFNLTLTASPSIIPANTPTNITFTVTSNSTPISNATITLTRAATGSALTNASGQAVITVNASAGNITAAANKSGYLNASIVINVTTSNGSTYAGTRNIWQQSLSPGDSTNVTVNITSNTSQSLSLKESIPAGWNLTRISDNANSFRADTNEWVWFYNSSEINRTVTYRINMPANASPEFYYINGTISNASEMMVIVSGENMITDLVAHYRSLGRNPNCVETPDLLKAADDWGRDIPPSGLTAGFNSSITTRQLLRLADEWSRGLC